MGKLQLKMLVLAGVFLLGLLIPIHNVQADEESENEAKKAANYKERPLSLKEFELPSPMKRFVYDSGLDFTYPDAVRGIYVTGPSAGGSRFEGLLNLVDSTDLNAMVIDIKEDHGNITFKPDEDSPYYDIAENYIKDPREMLKVLEEKGIYPIARVVVFKDSLLAKQKPEWSFTKNGQVWVNGRGEAFVNPFVKDVWEYNVEIAKMVAELGFRDIQFDYVRFPEGFERKDKELSYNEGDYAELDVDNVQKRVTAVTDFVAYAKEQLEPYGVHVSVDIFGYSATIKEAPGIGQNFSKISSNVDVISSMIYPSHWTSYFGIDFPDKEPYKLTVEYAKVENEVLGKLENPPISRPWIQDFEAPWLYSGPATQYGKAEVEAQIRALNENGINEYLIWNPLNKYSEGVDYTPLN
ncbi:putative glycoside hydrolase [Thalassobacillus hwangdonensis]|uniref:Glycoside hydrolase n=1 Tax=Thalassobacillus hwangdonensis TaxID=546108 RepID=A0ABW3KXK8_9BACI